MTHFVNGRADYRLSASDELSAQFGASVGDWRAGHSVHSDEPHKQDVSAQFLQIRFHRVRSSDDEWMVQGYFTRNKMDAPNATPICLDTVKGGVAACPGGQAAPPRYLATGQIVDSGIDQLQTRLNVEFQRNQRLAADWRAVWGAELRREAVESQRYFATRATFDGTLARAYVNLEWQTRPDLLLQGGAMLEHHYFTGTDVSPRLALNYTPVDGHTLRLNLSQAYRSPTFFEQHGKLIYYTITGAPAAQTFAPADPLEPERILSREIGYVGVYPAADLQVDAKLFHDSIDDYIKNKGSPSRFANHDRFSVRGGDVQLGWQPLPALRLSLQYARAFIHADPSIDRDLADSAPRDSVSLLARYELGAGWTASVGGYHSGRMKWLSDGDWTDAFTRWDVRLARRWTWQGYKMEAALVGQNLGEDYTEFRDTNIFSRRAYASFSLAW